MGLNKGALIAGLDSALRSASPGEDSVSQIVSAMADAIEAYVKSGVVIAHVSGGGCTYSGNHPPVTSTGEIT